jgi:uncharacterized RmlC-like cupin family protein
MGDRIRHGNAAVDGAPRRGWLVGHFLAETDGPRSTSSVGVKWGVHPAGEQRDAWALNREATTLSLLVSGRFRIMFPTETVLLARPGDYAIWAPGVPHQWLAEEESVVLTVRWPSADDSVELPEAP